MTERFLSSTPLAANAWSYTCQQRASQPVLVEPGWGRCPIQKVRVCVVVRERSKKTVPGDKLINNCKANHPWCHLVVLSLTDFHRHRVQRGWFERCGDFSLNYTTPVVIFESTVMADYFGQTDDGQSGFDPFVFEFWPAIRRGRPWPN